MRLPLLVSVPHAGLEVPEEVADLCVLTLQQIVEDGDEGAAEIYAIEDEVEAFVTTSVARAIVDLNRAEDDRGKDGVVKTHTCWDVPVYGSPLPDELIEHLLATCHRPYHARLTELASGGAKLGVDCHTMVAFGPPVAPDPGAERPWVCLSNGDGTCPAAIRWARVPSARQPDSFATWATRSFGETFTSRWARRTWCASRPIAGRLSSLR